TLHKNVYELGNGQWNISALRRFLDDILPKNSHFKGFEVTHDFPIIGRKTMLLNARRIYREGGGSVLFPPIILLAIEDVSEMMNVAEMLARHTNVFEEKMNERTQMLEMQIKELQKVIHQLKK
ncbi:MAG: AAA family ATPase, partial [Patescibacteria group bacterium]